MFYTRKNLYEFLKSDIDYQLQADFEFRYPCLFNDDSFLIDQLDFPQLDKNVGDVWLDGYRIPVHSTAKYGNEIRFTMYVENYFLEDNGKYKVIFDSLLSDNYDVIKNNRDGRIYRFNSPINADIIPLTSERKTPYLNNRMVRLYNALIKSISLDGGFSANTTTLSKFTVTMTFSLFEIL